jgi:hypothetical protein
MNFFSSVLVAWNYESSCVLHSTSAMYLAVTLSMEHRANWGISQMRTNAGS